MVGPVLTKTTWSGELRPTMRLPGCAWITALPYMLDLPLLSTVAPPIQLGVQITGEAIGQRGAYCTIARSNFIGQQDPILHSL